jgi:hypothetical protein
MVPNHTYLTWSTYLSRFTTHDKKGFWPNPQHDDWLVRRSIPNFSLITANEAVGKRQVSVDNRLLGVPGPYLWHVIGTFNTCSRGATYRSLTDTCGGYNLGGGDFPHHTPRPSQPMILNFLPNGPAWYQVIQSQHKPQVKLMWNTYCRLVAFRSLSVYWSLYLCLVMTNILQILARLSMVI